jgi:hypothetical protein
MVCTGHLQPHQTLCPAKVKPQAQPFVLGSSGHIYPGAQVESFKKKQPVGCRKPISRASGKVTNSWQLALKPYSASHTKVWIGLPNGMKEIRINGMTVPVREKEGLHYAEI